MYAGEVEKAPKMDPYADPTSAMVTDPPANGNGAPTANGGGRGRSHSRSRSRSPTRNRSPRRTSPPGIYSRRRSPPPPRRPSHAPMAPNPSQVLGVFGLSIRTVEKQLEEEFSRYGRPERVTIVYDARTGRSRGFGFIRMGAIEEATACIEKLNGIELDGRRIRVDYSVTDRPHQPTPGEYMGTRRDDRYRYDGGGGGGGGSGGRADRDRGGYGGSRRERDRGDPYGRDYRDWRDRDRDHRDWRGESRRSPPRGRYSQSPPPRRRRSYSRSPPRASGSVKREEEPDRSKW